MFMLLTFSFRLLIEKYQFLDGKNVAVYGRGSGATVAMEAAAIASSPQLFQCVALLSPISDWHAHGKKETHF